MMSTIGDLNPFRGKTYVAFIDISGFKQYIDENRAEEVIGSFYQYGADAINNIESDNQIGGIFVSDCGILYVKSLPITFSSFSTILNVIKKINISMISNDHLTTCSIAYGDFNYQPRVSSESYRKNALYGKGYVNAFSDNEYGVPKIKPGNCRILVSGLPFSTQRTEGTAEHFYIPNFDTLFYNLPLIKSRDEKYLYYYWMLDGPNKIDEYDENYKEIEDVKYKRLKKMIKNYINIR